MDIPSCPAWISQRHMSSFTATIPSPVAPSAKLAGSSMATQSRGAFCASGARIWHPHNATQLSFPVPERWPRDSSLSSGGYEQQPLTSLDSLESWITSLHHSFLLPLFNSSFFLSRLANFPVVKLYFFMVPQTYLMLLMRMGFHTIYLGSKRIKGIALFNATQMLYISNSIFMYSYSHNLTTHRQFLYTLGLGCTL